MSGVSGVARHARQGGADLWVQCCQQRVDAGGWDGRSCHGFVLAGGRAWEGRGVVGVQGGAGGVEVVPGPPHTCLRAAAAQCWPSPHR